MVAPSSTIDADRAARAMRVRDRYNELVARAEMRGVGITLLIVEEEVRRTDKADDADTNTVIADNDTKMDEIARLKAAALAIIEWYDRDGSVGGLEAPMIDLRSIVVGRGSPVPYEGEQSEGVDSMVDKQQAGRHGHGGHKVKNYHPNDLAKSKLGPHKFAKADVMEFLHRALAAVQADEIELIGRNVPPVGEASDNSGRKSQFGILEWAFNAEPEHTGTENLAPAS